VSELPDGAVTRLAMALVTPDLPERYEPLEVIGRGGMGVVWRALDRRLDREVAVKVLAEHVDSEALALRLRREARILARLEHPGVVSVHDAGTLPDGRTWYAMRLVRGERLDAAARRFTSLGEALRVVMRVAETVAFAHAAGVLHRDLTPRNVMLGPFGEVLILDWGVARDTGAADRPADPGEARPHGRGGPPAVGAPRGAVTEHGTVLGTPGYMAPEQARGLPADERSDVHGLGAILDDLLEALGRPVPKPLARVRDRARAPDPADRYRGAQAFLDDLVRFQDGDPVSAYREGPLDVALRLGRQHRTPILLVLAYLVMRLVLLWWRGI